MRIIATSRVRAYCRQHPEAATALLSFLKVAENAAWKNIVELRESYPHADAVLVASGKTVTVINIKGNAFRLILAIHYNAGRIFVLLFMRHADYSKLGWKDKL